MTPRPVSVRNLHRGLRAPARAAAALVRALDAWGRHPAPPGELSIVFLGDAALAELHGRFLDDPSVTDVITFPGDAAAGLAGEICVSADAALRQGPAHRRTPAEELALYLVHGYLHLAGHDDLAPGPRRAMRAAERAALRALEPLGPGGLFAWRAPR